MPCPHLKILPLFSYHFSINIQMINPEVCKYCVTNEDMTNLPTILYEIINIYLEISMILVYFDKEYVDHYNYLTIQAPYIKYFPLNECQQLKIDAHKMYN
jgi:hypothetical protein